MLRKRRIQLMQNWATPHNRWKTFLALRGVKDLEQQLGRLDIKRSFDYPSIPLRQFDWSAVTYATYDGPGCPIGRGPTRVPAIFDLIEQLEERW